MAKLQGSFSVRGWTWTGTNQDAKVVMTSGGAFSQSQSSATDYDLLDYGNAVGNYTIVKFQAGGNQPHNNMPPYLAVYVYKRIA